jgi:hypothetical protein
MIYNNRKKPGDLELSASSRRRDLMCTKKSYTSKCQIYSLGGTSLGVDLPSTRLKV